MGKVVYPVILTVTKECVLVEAPDLDILTEGKDIADAISMARDAVALKCVTLEDEGEPIPAPSELSLVDAENGTFAGEGDSIVTLVDVDIAKYRSKLDQRMVRRNVTIPAWMDREATREKINVSKVLQSALAQALNV